MGEVVDWAKGLDPSPSLIRIDMSVLERSGRLCKKGWATQLWQELRLAHPNLRALHLMPSPKTVDSFLAIMSTHGPGKMKFGLCNLYQTTNLVQCPLWT